MSDDVKDTGRVERVNAKDRELLVVYHSDIDYTDISVFCPEGSGTVKVTVQERVWKWNDWETVFESTGQTKIDKERVYVDSTIYDGHHLIHFIGETDMVDPNNPATPKVRLQATSVDD